MSLKVSSALRARAYRRSLAVALAILLTGALGATQASAAPDNAGTDFWVGFIHNYDGGATETLFITGGTSTTGTVTVPGASFTQDFSVTPGTVTTVALPASTEMGTAEGTQSKAVHVTAADDVTIYGLSREQFTTDAFLGLPVDVLTGRYTAMTWGPGCCGGSEIGIVATQDGTTVTITPKVATQGGHAAGIPFDVTLQRGDMYQLVAATNGEDLTGTSVVASAKIAVFGGHQCANIPNSSTYACDHVTEQLPPDDSWGTSFLTVPLKTRIKGDTFKFLADQDGTEVKVNGSTVATLNAGEQFQQIIDGQSTVTSDKPILVGQFSNGTSYDGVTSDPFFMLVPPYEQFQRGYTVTTPASGFSKNFVNLVVPDGEVGSVKLDGTAVPSSEFTPIGASGFQGAQLDVELGSHTLTGNGQPFGVFVYGFDSFDSYGYPGGLSLAPIARVAKVDLTPATATHLVRTSQCVTATVTDSSGARVGGVRVDFAVSGANTSSESVDADGSGQAVYCYTGTAAGSDAITGAVGSISGTAAKTWVLTLPSQAVEATAAKSALACTKRRITLIDVIAGSNRVNLTGATDPGYAGQSASIVYDVTKKVVAHATIKPDGTFATTAPLPAKSVRFTNTARYRASLNGQRSAALKLTRRIAVASLSSSGGKVTIKGRVLAPLGKPIQTVKVSQRVTCDTNKVVATFKPSKSGRFSVTFNAPAGKADAVYVLQSKVRKNATSGKLYLTKSLPRPVKIK